MLIVFIHVHQSVDHKKENANKNEEETIKKTDEPTVIVDIEVKRVYFVSEMHKVD